MKTKGNFGIVLLLLTGLYACDSSSDSSTDATTKTDTTPELPITVTDNIKNTTYGFTNNEDDVVFIFDTQTQADVLTDKSITDLSAIDKVEIRGTFNKWKSAPSFALTHSITEPSVWYLAVKADELEIPGNSGQAEYKFVVTADGSDNWIEVSSTTPTGYQFQGNHIIVTSDDSIDTIVANEIQANTEKKLADFDLTTTAGKEEIANFRQVPDTAKLFRSYHPYIKSHSEMDAETTRLDLVNALMVDNAIASVITLSGPDTGVAQADKFITDYMQAIIDADNNLILDISYNMVYFSSESAEFGSAVKSIVNFINDDANPAPFLIHCRLGTDRTGVMSAVLAGLAGASWADIAADYQLSNRMGITEFRGVGLVQYSLQHMLGVDPSDSSINLQNELTNYFVSNGYASKTELDSMVAKIK